MRIRFLIDENLSPRVKLALLRYNPAIDVLRVGDEDAPPLGTLDPDILRHAEAAQRLLVTDNRKSMPDHVIDHLEGGAHHWGIFLIRPNASIGQLVEELVLFWEASEAEEWVDRIEYIPLF